MPPLYVFALSRSTKPPVVFTTFAAPLNTVFTVPISKLNTEANSEPFTTEPPRNVSIPTVSV